MSKKNIIILIGTVEIEDRYLESEFVFDTGKSVEYLYFLEVGNCRLITDIFNFSDLVIVY